MKKIMLASALAVMLGSPARGDGVLAIAIPEDGLRGGFAYGLGYDYPNAAAAEAAALKTCREQANKFDVPASRCSVVWRFKRQCVAVAFDGDARWAGWGLGDNEQSASKAAVQRCSEGAPNCKVADLVCDRK
jgi:hypothetical protein